jgi:NAD(P)-dependent dehydrogenase (short-subunit alcohol dehydrogenase family)
VSDARGVAFVTGASRGIGKAIAVHLARAGYDVALAARTVHEGEEREHSSTIKRSDTTPLPGSLDTTAALIEAEGRRALPVFLDITDRTSLGSSVTTVLERWGRIDVLVNNARYIGPGHMDRLLETPVELLDKHLEANAMAPIILAKLVLPGMIERGSGCLITVTSSAGMTDPPAPAGDGGWGLGYGMSKGAVHRLVGIVKLEHELDGISAYNLHPGFVATERMIQDMGAFGFDASTGAPPDVIGAAAAWLATSPDARELNGQWVEGQQLCAELDLLPGWDPPSATNARHADQT